VKDLMNDQLEILVEFIFVFQIKKYTLLTFLFYVFVNSFLYQEADIRFFRQILSRPMDEIFQSNKLDLL
jgi:hypothetical protein